MDQYPWYTPYQFAGNNPISFVDLDGLEPATKEITRAKPVFTKLTEKEAKRVVGKLLKETGIKVAEKAPWYAQFGIWATRANLFLSLSQLVTKDSGPTQDERDRYRLDELESYNGEGVLKDEEHEEYLNLLSKVRGIYISKDSKISRYRSSKTEETSDVTFNSKVVDVTEKGALTDFSNEPGVYIHEFENGKVYVGQAKDLGSRPKNSLNELMDPINHKGTAANAGDKYSGKTTLIPLKGSGFKTLGDLEYKTLEQYGGTQKQGGATYNIRRVPGH